MKDRGGYVHRISSMLSVIAMVLIPLWQLSSLEERSRLTIRLEEKKMSTGLQFQWSRVMLLDQRVKSKRNEKQRSEEDYEAV